MRTVMRINTRKRRCKNTSRLSYKGGKTGKPGGPDSKQTAMEARVDGLKSCARRRPVKLAPETPPDLAGTERGVFEDLQEKGDGTLLAN